MHEMMTKLSGLGPEIALLIGATVCLFCGLSPNDALRRLTVLVAAVALVVACSLAATSKSYDGVWELAGFTKTAIACVGLLLLLVAAAVPERLDLNHDGAPWADVSLEQSQRGEFFAFFLS